MSARTPTTPTDRILSILLIFADSSWVAAERM
jgi:hypothetical protein